MSEDEELEQTSSESRLWEKEFAEDRELYELMIWAN